MRAVLLVGYGSVLPGIGTAMIRIASRISPAGIAPIAAAGFLSGCRPSFTEAVESCVMMGATDVLVQPYTLVEDQVVRRDLRRQMLAARERHPRVQLRLMRPIGDHPAIAQIAQQRALEADYAYSHGMQHLPLQNAHERTATRPPPTRYTAPATWPEQRAWAPLHSANSVGVLLAAHGSSSTGWDWPISAAAEWLRLHGRYQAVGVGYIGTGRPDLPTMLDQLASRGLSYLLILPFMLQLTREDAEHMQEIAQAGEGRHPHMRILVADHLNYDRRLLDAIRDRVTEAEHARSPRRGV